MRICPHAYRNAGSYCHANLDLHPYSYPFSNHGAYGNTHGYTDRYSDAPTSDSCP